MRRRSGADPWEWHDHGHEGQDPVVWLDALDLPLFVYLEGSYAREGDLQARRNRPDASEVEYRSAGLAPSRQAHRSRRYPMMRYPWDRTEAALRAMADHGDGVMPELDYVNPETGADVLPTMGFTAMMLGGRVEDNAAAPVLFLAFHIVRGVAARQSTVRQLNGPPRTPSARPFCQPQS